MRHAPCLTEAGWPPALRPARSDKTGTLTANDMRVTHLFVDRAAFRVRPSSAATPDRGPPADTAPPSAAAAPSSSAGSGGSSLSASASGASLAASTDTPAGPASGWPAPDEALLTASLGATASGGSLTGSLTASWTGASLAGSGSNVASTDLPGPAPASGRAAVAVVATESEAPAQGAGQDLLLRLGMDQATYVSLSLDGEDSELMQVLLAARRRAALQASAVPAAAAPSGAASAAAAGVPAAPDDTFHGLSARVRDLLVANITLNSTASVRYDAATRAMEHSGNRTECALLEFAYRLHGRREALGLALASRPRVVQALPFTSARKLMAVVVADPGATSSEEEGSGGEDSGSGSGSGSGAGGGGRWGTVYVKGAAEILLDRCRLVGWGALGWRWGQGWG
jgi:magnesium-transporting ATPase (P-type)